MTAKERVILAAVRFACLAHHCPMSAEEVVAAAIDPTLADNPEADFHALRDSAGRIVLYHLDDNRLAVERITAAINGLTGSRRIVAAYRANAGVLLPADVERIAAP